MRCRSDRQVANALGTRVERQAPFSRLARAQAGRSSRLARRGRVVAESVRGHCAASGYARTPVYQTGVLRGKERAKESDRRFVLRGKDSGEGQRKTGTGRGGKVGFRRAGDPSDFASFSRSRAGRQ